MLLRNAPKIEDSLIEVKDIHVSDSQAHV